MDHGRRRAGRRFGLPGATVTAGAVTTARCAAVHRWLRQSGAARRVRRPGARVAAGRPADDRNHAVATALALALGLGEPGAAGEAFAQLLSDPRGWLAARLRGLLSAADPAAVDASLGDLAADPRRGGGHAVPGDGSVTAHGSDSPRR